MNQYFDADLQLVGAGAGFEKDNSLNLATHAATPCTTTVLTMVSSPITAGFKKGDWIKVLSGGTEYRQISDISATTITVSTAFSGAPSTSVAIYRWYRNMGATKGGIELKAQLSVTDIEVDQALDPVAGVTVGRATSVMVPLTQVDGYNLLSALGLTSTALTASGSTHTVKVGLTNNSTTMKSYILLGENAAGELITVKLHKAVNTGQVTLRFAKPGEQSVMALELKVYADTTQTSGQELMIIKKDTAWDLSL